MSKNKKIKVNIIKATGDKTNQSKQMDDIFKDVQGVIHPKYNPSDLIYAYNKSFVLSGIATRIATVAASGWIYPDNMPESSKKAIESIDLEYVFASLFITGNVYLEKVRNLLWNMIARFENFLTDEVRIARQDTWLKYIQKTSNTNQAVEFMTSEVVHAKQLSLNSRYYGESRSVQCIQQIALLGHIDQYYEKLFVRGFFKTKMLIDKWNALEWSDGNKDNIEAIKTAITDRMKGIDNAFSIMHIPADVTTEDFDSDADTAAFLDYRKDLIRSIAIALIIPIDIVLPEGSARATKESSLEELNRDIITPLQERFLNAMKSQITEQELPGITGLQFFPIDTKNALDEMKINTGYVDSGIFTANEVRTSLGKDEREDWDGLKKKEKTPDPQKDDTKIMEEINKTIEASYGSYKH